MDRPTKGAARLKKYGDQETGTDKSKNALRNTISRSCKTIKDRKKRWLAMKACMKSRLRQEPLDQLNSDGKIQERLANEYFEQRANRLGLINERLANESAEQKTHRLGLINERLANESAEQKTHRLGLINERLEIKSTDQRAHRLEGTRNRIATMSAQQHENRLAAARQTSQRLRSMNKRNFITTINQYTEVPCTICKKYLYQKLQMLLVTARFDFFPEELVKNLDKNAHKIKTNGLT